ncbi:sulfite exporter TauE/SafE family protein [Oceanobacillus piezotolerans]|uniref:Probable membrane transporter protein n=1 Tax=Oceanobacillus piezotolerans TaxID=2448030 RepID=A0A498D9W1_9BACI|nr:sulfite exporter TauE/SafE family protein [Oceanobacillus piezotolerans]RLL46524.1 sulfite exporter TauE/SafE family protein [Oceanobacillus piezotolerans]
MFIIICLLIGTLAAFVGAIAGLGGGLVLVPSLFFLQHISDAFSWATPQTVVGISLLTMIFTGLSSTLAYVKVKRVDYRTGIIFLSGSIPGGMLGSWLNQFIHANEFLLYFGCLMIFISLLLFIKKDSYTRKIPSNKKGVRTIQLEGKEYHYRVNMAGAFILSIVVGILSGLFGIGGGSIIVPAMMLLYGIPAHIATATSMFIIFFVSLSSSFTHIILGHIEWEYVLLFIPGAWLGGKLGAKVNQLLSSKTLEWVLRILFILIGVRMIFQGLS